ncbi:dihydrolipoamide acetyltransferase family protein [Alkalibacillus almallahensis]|uniref:dihydrolipoamide acetyltransferase family protein n=1 Tax=Alkalibacillus almallahensis TaxID=1379154 RepID=UPI00141DFD0F|nr:dihydrolipoamide acetyltransferase family protein [Alkalibacillus almallahensis]NIK12387.1 2-oxoisovalerate dehydrogenase E2 component (dihydrolipoyl transacylase) [Alkalibacillus almallahensis]
MSVEKVEMPQLGESVTEGTISSWLVSAGDQVNKYDPIAEVMTDKVNAEVPSSFSGKITELVASEGDTIEVGGLIAYIEVEGGASEASSGSGDETSSEQGEQPAETSQTDQSMKKRYSPAVLKMAQEHDIDLNQVTGSGKGGRITRKDIEAIVESGEVPQASQEPAQTTSTTEKSTSQATKPSQAPAPSAQTGDVEVPVSGVRKAIAQNMVKSTTEIPHAWMMVEVDVTNLVQLREQKKTEFKQKEGYSLTYFAFFVKAVAQALKEFPELNSMWADDKIIQKKDINLSIAVASDNQLFVPVIKNADDKSVKGIAKDIVELAAKARDGKLTNEDMSGGTFTVNNTGSFGSVQSMGVINHPQAAILQVESIVKRPVYMDGMFGARDMVNLCLSLDHRVLDGLICGQFLQRVKEILENMTEDNTSIY